MAFVRLVFSGVAVPTEEMWQMRKRRQLDFREGDLLRVVRDVGDGHLLDHFLLDLDGLDDGDVLDDLVRLSNFDCFEDWDLLDDFDLEKGERERERAGVNVCSLRVKRRRGGGCRDKFFE